MPLIDCPACRHPVSSEAERCPVCGQPIKRGFLGRSGTERMLDCGCLLVIVFILAGIVVFCVRHLA